MPFPPRSLGACTTRGAPASAGGGVHSRGSTLAYGRNSALGQELEQVGIERVEAVGLLGRTLARRPLRSSCRVAGGRTSSPWNVTNTLPPGAAGRRAARTVARRGRRDGRVRRCRSSPAGATTRLKWTTSRRRAAATRASAEARGRGRSPRRASTSSTAYPYGGGSTVRPLLSRPSSRSAARARWMAADGRGYVQHTDAHRAEGTDQCRIRRVDLEGQRFLVTGGAGFVGSHIVDRLVAAGAESSCSTDAAPRTSATLADACEVVEGDVTDAKRSRGTEGVDGLFHTAVLPLGPTIGTRGAASTSTSSARSTCSRPRARPAWRRSSSRRPRASTATPTRRWTSRIRSARARCTARARSAARLPARARHAGRLEYVILRYMNVYGPRQDAGLVWRRC